MRQLYLAAVFNSFLVVPGNNNHYYLLYISCFSEPKQANASK